MSENSDKGRLWELAVAKITRRKLDKSAARNKGSHANWHRSSDVYNEIGLHIECKHHETLKPKEWYRQAEAAASFSQTPVVVFESDGRAMALLEYAKLLDAYVEIEDLKAEVADLRKPVYLKPEQLAKTTHEQITPNVGADQLKPQGVRPEKTYSCREGHMADQYGYCQWKGCKYARGYKAPSKPKHSPAK